MKLNCLDEPSSCKVIYNYNNLKIPGIIGQTRLVSICKTFDIKIMLGYTQNGNLNQKTNKARK